MKGFHDLPFLGRVKAGFAAPAEDELADTVSVGEYLVKHKESSFLLQVDGDSMSDAGIMDGDMVIFERGREPRIGNIVIALTEDGYTIKYLRKDKSGFYLEPANKDYPKIRPREGQVIGVVTSSFRTYK